MNAQVLLLDVWADLRSKPWLLPAVALLAILVIALPLLLREPAVDAPPPATPTAGTPAKAAELPLVSVVTLSEASKLGVFRPKDPFQSRVALASKSASSAGAGAQGTPGSPPLDAGAQSSAGGGSSPSAGSGSGDQGGTSGSSTSAGSGSSTQAELYTFAARVTFAEGDAPAAAYTLQESESLPSERTPLITFVGLTDSLGSAIFVIDPTLTHSGEGTCKPSRDACLLLYLRPDAKHDWHSFTAPDGTRYVLRLREVGKTKANLDSLTPLDNTLGDSTADTPRSGSSDGQPAP